MYTTYEMGMESIARKPVVIRRTVLDSKKVTGISHGKGTQKRLEEKSAAQRRASNSQRNISQNWYSHERRTMTESGGRNVEGRSDKRNVTSASRGAKQYLNAMTIRAKCVEHEVCTLKPTTSKAGQNIQNLGTYFQTVAHSANLAI